MANEFYDLFNQLFYSTEVWGYLGVVLVVGFCCVVAWKVKFTGVLFALLMAIMGVDYLAKMTATGYYAMHFIICVVSAMVLGYLGVSGIIEDRKK